MMKIVDGIASEAEQKRFEEAVANDSNLSVELIAYRRIKEVTDEMQFKEMPDSYWDSYWGNVYRKLERGTGWIFFSIGAILILAFGLVVGLSEMYTDPGVSIIIKVGVTAVGLGAIILLVSFLRERFFARKHERYEREVQR